MIRRVDGERFRVICTRAEANPDQIHELDVADILFGAEAADHHIGPRLSRKVNAIIDQSLNKIGYATPTAAHGFALFFPGYSSTMGAMKCRALAQDIAALLQGTAPSPTKEHDRNKAIVSRSDASLSRQSVPQRPRLPQALADAVAGPLAAESEGSDVDLPPGYRTHSVPLWLAKKRSVVGAVIEPVRVDAGPRGGASAGIIDGLDLPLLAQAARQIDAATHLGRSSLTVVPVHWDCLDQPRLRSRYLEFCASLPETSRRLLVLELIGMPEDLMTARIEERINQLRRVCRSVICRVRIARRDFTQFNNLPIYAVGISLDDLPHYERGIIPAFDMFMDAVEANNHRGYVLGLASKSMLIAVQAAGVEFAAGPIIPESDTTPLGIRDFQIAELYGATAIETLETEK